LANSYTETLEAEIRIHLNSAIGVSNYLKNTVKMAE